MNYIKYWWDIETPKGAFLASYLDENGIWYDFHINKYKNDLYKLIKFLEDKKEYIGFNTISFDAQVIKYIWDNYEYWLDLTNLQIAEKIYQFAQELIDNQNYGLFLPYKETELIGRNIDVFKIQHFDNKNRRVGLKRLEYEMDAINVQEMDVSPHKEDFTEKEIEELCSYCHNDIIETKHNYEYIIGEVENPIYKGNDQIEIRDALTEEFKFDCTNFSNSKFGDEIIKTIYCKEASINYKDLPKKGTFRKVVKFKYGIPDYVEFETPDLKSFLKRMKDKQIGAYDEFEESVSIGKQIHTFALGGIHNKIQNKQYHSDDEYIIIDADVTGYYPRTIMNNQYSPAHLDKKSFINSFSWVVNERERLKPQAKTNKKIKGIVGGYKEASNAAYGKMGDPTNWLYDPQARLNVCLAGEMSILMLIERNEIAGNECIMSNTDGATFIVKRSEVDKFYEICKDWCKLTDYALEYFEFKSMWFSNVNSYLAIKMDGEVKAKGEFLIHSELHKNKSFRVIPLALHAYFIEDKSVEEFINNFDNIFHFCARSTGGNTYKHKYFKDNKSYDLPKLIRYYVSKEGVHIMKIVKEGNDTNASDTNVQPAELTKLVCNYLPEESHKDHLAKVNRQWYIDKTNELIYQFETGKKPKRQKIDKNQTSLF